MKYEITSNQFDRLASLEYDLRILATDAAYSKYIHARAINTLAAELRALVMRIEMQDIEE